ncbi:MAG: hypothetical protein FWF88_01410 [Peptococcaceae bacterium]|nr:hypothetical protein [Peptococcaceae bacterium]
MKNRIIVTTCIALCLFVCTSCDIQRLLSPEAKPTVDSESTDLSEQKQIFTSSDNAYQIEVPREWERYEGESGTISVTGGAGSVFFTVFITDKEEWNLDLQGLSDYCIDFYQDHEAYQDVVREPQVSLDVGGFPAIFTQLSFTSDSLNYYKYHYALETDTSYVRLVGELRKSKKDEYEPIIKEIAASFKEVVQE